MTTIKRSADVKFTPSQMYDLVNAVEDYAQFLPGCRSSCVLSRSDDEVKATLELSGGGFHKSFTTINRLQKDKMIEVRLLNGPFRHLEGFWRFDPLPEHHCRVTLDLEFEFSSRFFSLAMGPLFNQVTHSLVDAFCQRAAEIYGS